VDESERLCGAAVGADGLVASGELGFGVDPILVEFEPAGGAVVSVAALS
jgi:hypothetical protein